MNYRNYLSTAILIAASALLHLNASAADEYYRWIDERGETILSDRPPAAGIDYERVSTNSRFSSADIQDGDNSEQQGAAAAAPKAKSQKNPELCRIAMENFDALNNSDRITMRDENGNAKVLSEKEIKEHFKTTKAQIDAFCE